MDRIYIDDDKITFVSETHSKEMELICEDFIQAERIATKLFNINMNMKEDKYEKQL